MPRLWLTYAWKDNDEGDFDYLVSQLRQVECDVLYDKIQLIPGFPLWDQIANKISSGLYDGWAYLLTPRSLTSQACREELTYALQRALTDREGFPLIGLVYGVSIHDIPVPLKVRLCVDLSDPSWVEQVMAGLERRPPREAHTRPSRYKWYVHQRYLGVQSQTAIEVRPRLGEIHNWKFIVPGPPTNVIAWGHGEAGGKSLATVGHDVVNGTVTLSDQTPAGWYGAGDTLSPGTSAYIVFDSALPRFVGFGYSASAMIMPAEWETYGLGENP